MKHTITIDRHNFNDIMFTCCGIYNFRNPFVCNGEERLEIVKYIEWQLSSNYNVVWKFDEQPTDNVLCTEDGIPIATEDGKYIEL